ncbi:MAG: sialidase family protein [Gemmatimonadota bacterium]|nr:sialidase family protein [Gemmatimonadota bacterium]
MRLATAILATVLPLAACGVPAPDRADAGAESPSGEPVAVEIASPAGPGSGEPFLAIDGEGRAVMSWLQEEGENAHALRFAVRETERWGEARTIARGTDWFVNWADFPSILPLDDGSLAAHWLVRSGPQPYAYDVVIARSDDGGRTWSRPVRPHRDDSRTEHGFVSLIPWKGGSIGAAWLDGRRYAVADSQMTVRFARLDDAGRPAETALLDERACDCCQTDAALTSDGPLLVYRDRSPEEIRDISAVRFVDGSWSDPVPVHRDGWEIAACPVNGPAVAASGERVAVAWFTAAGGDPAVRVAFSDDAGASFGAPVEIDGGDPLGRVDVAMLEGDEAAVSWLERRGDAAWVVVRRVAAARPPGDPATIARTGPSRSSGFPRFVVLGKEALFAWTDPDASRVRVATVPLERIPAP